jgi:hypothetical protein
MRMKAVRVVFMAAVGIACFAASRTSDAEPVLESFRVDPDRLCLRDAFRWGSRTGDSPAVSPRSRTSR